MAYASARSPEAPSPGTAAVDSGAVAPASVDAAPPPEPPAPEPSALVVEDEPAPAPERVVVEGEMETGHTLGRLLRSRGVTGPTVHLISREMRGHFDFRRAMPGHRFRVVQDPEGNLIEFRYLVSEFAGWSLAPAADGWTVEPVAEHLIPRAARLAGVVDKSLYQAIRDLGELPELASDFAEIFAWDVDFSRSAQRGDEFRVIYERLYRRDADGVESYVRPGRILAARYDGTFGRHEAFYFETQEGRAGYYRPDGTSVEGAFLRAPLRYARITSRFTSARRHPILKITRPHHGIDYAAPLGTPVWSVADGEVIYRGYAGGFGNLIKIRHTNGYVSYYAHLNRFAKKLRVGHKVHQKQVIGYVGQTGLATGPHICFRIAHNGSYVNPARIPVSAGAPVPEDARARFQTARDILHAELESRTLVSASADNDSL